MRLFKVDRHLWFSYSVELKEKYWQFFTKLIHKRCVTHTHTHARSIMLSFLCSLKSLFEVIWLIMLSICTIFICSMFTPEMLSFRLHIFLCQIFKKCLRLSGINRILKIFQFFIHGNHRWWKLYRRKKAICSRIVNFSKKNSKN